MSRNLVGACLLAALLGIAAGPGLAEDLVTPRGELPLLSGPPGLFRAKGDQIGTAARGRDYRVLEQRDVLTIGGSEVWLRVAPVDGPDGAGWIYAGPGGDPTANVEQKGGQP